MKFYEQYVRGEIGKEYLRAALDTAHDAKSTLTEVIEQKEAYGRKYCAFRKLLFANDKRIPLSEIIGYIDKIIVDAGRKIVVKWSQP